MKNNSIKISEISRSLIEIAWHFGARGLNGECCNDISMPEFMALYKIVNTHNCSVRDIGMALGFTKSGATRIVNRLESKGYLQKMTSTEDARVCCVIITRKGENIIKDVDSIYKDKLEHLISKMPAKQREKAKEILKSMARELRN